MNNIVYNIQEIEHLYNQTEGGEWKIITDDIGDDYLALGNDGHQYLIGNLEDTDYCCYLPARLMILVYKNLPDIIKFIKDNSYE